MFFFPFLFFPTTVLPVQVHPLPALAIAYLGAVVTLGAYALYNYGVSRIPVSRASVFINLSPVFTVLLGAVILGERFSFYQYVASGFVFAGIYLSQKE